MDEPREKEHPALPRERTEEERNADNLAGFFDLLFRIDRRENPHLYQPDRPATGDEHDA